MAYILKLTFVTLVYRIIMQNTQADPGRGGGRPMIFCFLFSLASLAIHFKPKYKRNRAKTCYKVAYTSTVNTFNVFTPFR